MTIETKDDEIIEKASKKSTSKTTKKKKTKKKKNKMETSKIIILASYIIAIILTLLVIIGTFSSIEVSNLTTITCLVWAEVSVSNMYYFKKAGKENVPKVIASLPELFREKVDVNQLLNQD